MTEYVTISVERLRELEALEEMHKQMEEDGKAVDAWIQDELKKMKENKSSAKSANMGRF